VCHDAIYESLDLGYVACDDGHWTFTATDPSADGYTLVSDAGSGIDDASPQDAGSADDAGANDDASSGDGG
jgi:hypothetical protein